MIDRRTFLARSSVATALAAVSIQSGAAQASPLALPATIALTVEVVEVDVQELESFEGFWSTYDQVNQRFLSNHIKLWATHDRCCMTVSSDHAGSTGERIEFEDSTIAREVSRMHGKQDLGKPADTA